MRETPWVFWASSAVITAVPTAPRAVNVFRSAWIPAQPLGSVPAMENATGGRWAHIQAAENHGVEPHSHCGTVGLDSPATAPPGRSRECVHAASGRHSTHTGYRFIMTKPVPSLALSRSGSPGVFSARSLRGAGSSEPSHGDRSTPRLVGSLTKSPTEVTRSIGVNAHASFTRRVATRSVTGLRRTGATAGLRLLLLRLLLLSRLDHLTAFGSLFEC